MILQVGVKIFLQNEEGKYLIVHRSAAKYPEVKDPWDIVGGRMNPGLPLFENLKREVREETQLEIISAPRLIAAQDILRGAEKHVVRLSYIGETRGEPKLDTEENDAYKWVSINEMRSQPDLDRYVKEIIASRTDFL